MWRSVVQHDVPRRGDRLRKDSFIGNGYLLWTEYEILEAGEIEITLKPLASNGHVHHDDPARYKIIRYPALYEKGMRIWIDLHTPASCSESVAMKKVSRIDGFAGFRGEIEKKSAQPSTPLVRDSIVE